MILREYQQQVLSELNQYLGFLAEEKIKFDKVREAVPEAANGVNYPADAWKKLSRKQEYSAVHNELGEPLANVWMKVPTGGGKTLLACHAIGDIQQLFLQRQNGLVVWVVPSTQIYRQTLKNLQDRQHPYRQTLDMTAAGRVMVVEKGDKFTLQDLETHLVILLVMSQSVMVRNKEGRKVFRDNTGYTSFFPAEDAYAAHEELLKRVHNLEYFEPDFGVGGKIVKSSLGNVLRISRPVIIVDEGHKNKSLLARDTLRGFNPVFMLELSATPPRDIDGRPVNIISVVTGKQLNDEEMIKLDLNVINKHSSSWHDTVAAAKDRRDELERAAHKYRENSGKYIRPIALFQVERTGKDQHDEGLIHADDVRDYLHKKLGIPDREIAIKSSEKDELVEHTDLLAEDCPVRYIITKQALQEGWDCSFAYVLGVLGGNRSQTALTQLIGRILRQPYAAKTGTKLLDESYVYAYQQDTTDLLNSIKVGLEGEGLGDIVGRISVVSDRNEEYEPEPEITAKVRVKFEKSIQNLYLPVFAVHEKGKWRELNYERDILAHIDFGAIDLRSLSDIKLSDKEVDDTRYIVGYGEDVSIRAEHADEVTFKSQIDKVDLVRRIVDIVPNPWEAYDLIDRALEQFSGHNDREIVAGNLAYILEQTKQAILVEIDRLAKEKFVGQLQADNFRFFVVKTASNKVADTITFRTSDILRRPLHHDLSKSLYDKQPSDANEFEKHVMWYMEDQERLLWWYRNIARAQYGVRGWKKHAVYPDFVATRMDDGDTFDKLYLLETKGEQLAGNLDTKYKQELFDVCNLYAKEASMGELLENAPECEFMLVHQPTWEQQLSGIFAEG